jgi:lysophospholipase L1-like esterase
MVLPIAKMPHRWGPEIDVTDLEIRALSLFPPRLPARLLALLAGIALLCAPSATPAADAAIAAWGDSLTLGFGMARGDDYPSIAAKLLGRPVENHGIGGQTSTQIAARMGALPVAASIDGGVIPASGPVFLTLGIDIVLDTAFGAAEVDGTLCGVHGTLAHRLLVRRFTRSEAGAATPCPAGSAFLPDVGATTHDGTVWLWLGRNGADPGRSIEADVAAAVAALGHDRYLVAPVLTAGTDSDATLAAIATINANLQAAYGPRYVDALAALLAAGDGSPEDTADITRGVVPRSLRWDFVHLTRRGNEIVAAAFADATRALGY